ncbi:MAG: hypothetical protein JWQ38_3807 [Flavipsychrobacter sp.]|nr:hypothetical protein [Flavipsychrobacter sp.]
MNNLDKVFSALKKQCERQKTFAELNNFDLVAKEAGISVDKLPAYLKHLQDIGLIKYSIEDNYIYLTRQGHERKTMLEF